MQRYKSDAVVGCFRIYLSFLMSYYLMNHCLPLAALMLASLVFFKGHMEYDMRIIILVGELNYWLMVVS